MEIFRLSCSNTKGYNARCLVAQPGPWQRSRPRTHFRHKKDRLRFMQDPTKQKKIRRNFPTCRLKRPSKMLCWHHLEAPAQLRRGSDSGPARDVSLQPRLRPHAASSVLPKELTSPRRQTLQQAAELPMSNDVTLLGIVISQRGNWACFRRIWSSPFLRAHQMHADDPFPVQASSTRSSSGLLCLPVLAVVSSRKR